MSLRRLAALTLAPLAGAVALAAQSPGRCGTPEPVLGRMAEAVTDCDYQSTNPSGSYAPTFLYQIPVVVHVIQHSDGRGALTAAVVQSQIDVLNEDYRAEAGSLGAGGFDTRIGFHLADTDPSGLPTNGITYHTDDQWFADRGSYWNTLAWDPNRYLNIYTNDAGGNLGYVPDVPQGGGLVGSPADRVVVRYSAFGRDAPIGPPYDRGRTVTHEVGHYLGLFHTFAHGCGTSDCYHTGDLICDTERESQAHLGCAPSSSCGSVDPIDNYMDYSDDLCMHRFTSEQSRRMRCTLQFWRPQLATSCPLANATSRNVAPNPQSYTVTPPVLGDLFSATVDVASTGHSYAALFGYTAPGSFPVGNGYTILMDLAAPYGNLLALPAAVGPSAQFVFVIPNLHDLCGLQLYTQAAHFGGASGFALSNAQDLVFGSD